MYIFPRVSINTSVLCASSTKGPEQCATVNQHAVYSHIQYNHSRVLHRDTWNTDGSESAATIFVLIIQMIVS
jgi:hypothetical protein